MTEGLALASTAIRAALLGAPSAVPGTGDGPILYAIVLGLAAIGVAVAGVAWLARWHRSRSAQPAHEDRGPTRVAGARPGSDPIVAALGIDEEIAARRAIRRARQAERESHPTSAKREP